MLSLCFPFLFLLLLAAAPEIQAYPNPEPCKGVCDYVHDPTVVRRASDGTYFRFVTFEDIQIATAPTMQGPWENQGPVLPNGTSIFIAGENTDSTWAPDAHLIGDTYYLYYAVSSSGSQNSQIGVATSRTMEPGSWTDHGSLGIPSSLAYNLIDPNLYILNGPTGPNYFLTFGSYWDGIYQIPMTDPLTIAPHADPQNLAFNPDGIHPVEGSYQFWWPTNGIPYYYLFLSVGICCNKPPNLPPPGQEYHITVCRSISPTGPFYDRNGDDCLAGGGTTVLASHDDVYAPGGEGVLYDPEENSIVLYYHYINPKIGYGVENYQFGYNFLTMDALGWPVLV